MRTSQYLLSTIKEIPADTEIISHQLMLRAGMIRKVTSGLYTWLPTGLRVLKKIENIVREEMNKCGAIEISMPIIQPASIWHKSDRWKKYGAELLNFLDRNKNNLVLSPTYEEMITKLISNEITSYKQLPLIFFQIQVKFRDEIRPRFGIMRSREFLMKDAYSLHISQKSLQETYNKMYETYIKIFTRIGLNFRVVQANTGIFGGIISHEFQVLANNGEDKIAFSDSSNYAANIEFAEAINPKSSRLIASEKMRIVDTPGIKTIIELAEKFNLSIKKIVKTLLVKAAKGSTHPLIALVIRGDHEINEFKVGKLPQVDNPLTFATETEIRSIINSGSNFLGPVNMPFLLIVDRAVSNMNDFVAGANIDGKYYFGINWNRDVKISVIADIRNVVNGDPSPDGKGKLIIRRSIEVGHIFQLGTKYSQIMNLTLQNKDGSNQILNMGCYGIGITRLVAAIIEQNYDDRGILWKDNLAPFKVVILPINMHKSCRVSKLSEKIYKELIDLNIDALIDDRKTSVGVMFNDMELIGIPHMLIISERSLDNQQIEYVYRRKNIRKMIQINEIIDFLLKKLFI